jgi:hypothetical protein
MYLSQPACLPAWHLFVPQAIKPRGVDPVADARERQLQKLATRGVVLLFNAVTKAQKQKQEAEGAKGKAAAKAAKAAKTGIFAELKAGAKAAASLSAPSAAAAGGSAREQQQQDGDAGGSGWAVLGEGFPGLTGGVKMKDWDKAADSDEDRGEGPGLAGSDDGDDSGDEGGAW